MALKLGADCGHDCPAIGGAVATSSVTRLFVKGFAEPDREIR